MKHIYVTAFYIGASIPVAMEIIAQGADKGIIFATSTHLMLMGIGFSFFHERS